MQRDTLNTRSVAIAVLFGPPLSLTSKQATDIHAAVCDALGLEDVTFAYRALTDTPGAFAMQLQHADEKNVLQVTVECRDRNKPVRLLVTEAWPAAPEELGARFDCIVDAVFDAWPDEVRRVLVETRLRADAKVGADSAADYLNNELVLGAPDWIDTQSLPSAQNSIRYRWPAIADAESSELRAPARDLQVEPLNSDPSGLYLELVSRWVTPNGESNPGVLDRPASAFLQDSNAFVSGDSTDPRPTKTRTRAKNSRKRKVEPTAN